MVTGYDAKDFARCAKTKIMVDIDNNELKKKDMKLDLKIACDARYFIEKLYKYMKDFKKNSDWINYCQKIRTKYPIVISSMKKQKKYVNSYYFVDTLSEVLNKKDTIVTDMGFSFTSSHQAFQVKEGQVFYTNSGHAPMGWGLPASVGAFYAKKNTNRVICLTGEGGFQMNIQELATIMHNKIPIKIFIFNNGGYLTIKQTQQLGFNGRIMGADKKSGISFPNYNKIAQSHKISYSIIKSNKNIKDILKKIIYSKGPYICELLMDPDEEQIPKAINKRTPDGKSVPTKLEDMYPFLPKEELYSNDYENLN
jgi:acetolactate synthase-1/2/3 large subunit